MSKRNDIPVNGWSLWDTARTLQENQRQRGSGPMTPDEWKRLKLYGACTVCGQTMDEDRWEVGNKRSGIFFCCGEACAMYLYESSIESWDRAQYGTCSARGCNNAVRTGSNGSPPQWGIEVKSEDDVLTTLWTCSEKCAHSVGRGMGRKRRSRFSWLGL